MGPLRNRQNEIPPNICRERYGQRFSRKGFFVFWSEISHETYPGTLQFCLVKKIELDTLAEWWAENPPVRPNIYKTQYSLNQMRKEKETSKVSHTKGKSISL